MILSQFYPVKVLQPEYFAALRKIKTKCKNWSFKEMSF